MIMQRPILILFLAALIGGAAGPRAAKAASDQTICLDRDKLASDMREAGEMIRQGLEKALGTIDTALRTMPRYELPTLDSEGNIIIRRKPAGLPGAEPDRPGKTI
jgi:hypothetical protein